MLQDIGTNDKRQEAVDLMLILATLEVRTAMMEKFQVFWDVTLYFRRFEQL
jgi:hypothetical protein